MLFFRFMKIFDLKANQHTIILISICIPIQFFLGYSYKKLNSNLKGRIQLNAKDFENFRF